jgi:hypothetical protein
MSHSQPALTPTRHSRELERRFLEAVRDYRRLNPDAGDADVRTALMTSLRQVAPPEDESRQRRVALAIVAALLAAFGAVALASSRSPDGDEKALVVMGIVAAAGGIVIAALRFARRG